MTAGSSGRGGAGEGTLEDEEEHVARIVLQEEWDELEGEDELEGGGEDALEEGGEVALEVEGGAKARTPVGLNVPRDIEIHSSSPSSLPRDRGRQQKSTSRK